MGESQEKTGAYAAMSYFILVKKHIRVWELFIYYAQASLHFHSSFSLTTAESRETRKLENIPGCEL